MKISELIGEKKVEELLWLGREVEKRKKYEEELKRKNWKRVMGFELGLKEGGK